MAIVGGETLITVPEFVVSELTGDKRRIVLSERALPYRGVVEFSGEHRAEWTSYPGNPVRTVQMLGAEEEPTEANGVWKDRFIGDKDNVVAYYEIDGQRNNLVSAFALVDLFNDVRRKGQEVVLQWGPVVRRGILRRFTFRPLNIHDVEWSMRFEWASQNDSDAPSTFSTDTDLAQSQGSLLDKVQGLFDIVANAEDVAADKLALIALEITNVSTFVDEFIASSTSVLTTAISVLAQARRVTGILDDLSDAVDDVTDLINAFPAVALAVPSPFNDFTEDQADAQSESTTVNRPSATQPTSSPTPSVPTIGSGAVKTDQTVFTEGVTLAVELFYRQLLTLLRDASFIAAQTKFSILKQVNPNIIASFSARQDTDLREVSIQFYGTQDEWRSIMIFNEFTSSKLDAGMTVFIPDLFQPLDGSV